MEQYLIGLLEQWRSVRDYSVSFTKELDEHDLDRRLPRKGLDTIRKHLEEMFEVQKDFVKAIGSFEMDFDSPPDDEISGRLIKEELLNNMQQVDDSLTAAVEKADPKSTVIWFGQKRPLSFHLSGLIAHEVMHIGQIIAFCYALDIDIPAHVVKGWALSGK